jgi:hypothetical protein
MGALAWDMDAGKVIDVDKPVKSAESTQPPNGHRPLRP